MKDAKDAIETGVITGTLLKDGKLPMAGYPVTLEIMRGNELILTIPKQTDSDGSYQFKNIFQSPDFTYAVSTEYDEKAYRTDFVSLKKGEKLRRLNLIVGAISEGTKTGGRENIPANEYKLLAVLLSLAAVSYAVYQRKKCKSH